MKQEFSYEFGWMITRVTRRRKRFMTARLAEKGLGGALYHYVLAVHHNPGESQDFLVEYFCADKGNVARAVKKLEEEGFIRREADKCDRRQNCIVLTEKGEEAVKEVDAHLREWNKLLTAGFTDEELEIAHRLISRMEQNVSDAFDGNK